jgi:hypothetical protein
LGIAEKGKEMNPLTDEQRRFAVAVLSQDLMRGYELVKSNKNASGTPLGQQGRGELMDYIGRLRDVLEALGMAQAQLDQIAEQFGAAIYRVN